jgi:hypothetical protein
MHHFSRYRAHLSEEYLMKHLLRVLFLLTLVCGCASHARANSFHATVLDPVCVTNPDAACTLLPTDPGTPFAINLTAQTCLDQHVSGLPTDGTPFGCFVGTNDTGLTINSINLTFEGAPLAGATCDTNLPNGAFAISSCTAPSAGDPDYGLSFSDGSVINSNAFIILETGIDPADFIGTATVGVAAVTPEPNSLLLLSTGVMMAGLYLMKRQSLFAFLKK